MFRVRGLDVVRVWARVSVGARVRIGVSKGLESGLLLGLG